MPRTTRSPSNGRQLSVGRRVTFRMGNQTIKALIIEDRGPIGVGGRRLMRVKLIGSSLGGESDATYELPAEDLTPVN